MDIQNTSKMKHGFIASIMMIFTLLYVFCYQFNYPFTSTVFLYASFGCMLIYVTLTRFLKLGRQFYLLFLVILVSWFGVAYTDNQEMGQREGILLLVMLLYVLVLSQDNVLVRNMRKALFLCSFVVLAGVLIQFTVPDAFNSFMSPILRSDCYEQLKRSYNVDGAYAGFSAYTPDAAYFSSLIFGFSILNVLENRNNKSRLRKIILLILAFLSVFVVILTSKRGLIVAMLAAIALTVMIGKKKSPKTILAFGAIIVVGIFLVYYIASTNTTVDLFLRRFDVSESRDITTGRTDMWLAALETFGDTNPLIGKGTGATYTIEDAGMHNIYLQIFYDHGIIGFLIYVVFFVYNLRKAIINNDSHSLFIQFVMLIYGISGNPIYSNSFFITYITYTVFNYQESYELDAEGELS